MAKTNFMIFGNKRFEENYMISINGMNINRVSILLKETRVCVFAKWDQFLPVRSQFDSNQHVNSVRIATFQSANFGPLLFAFYCPLLFYENKIKN